VEFLRQRNSVSRTTYILTISHGHTWCLPHLLSQKPLHLQIDTKSQINRPTSMTHLLSSSQKEEDIFHPTTAVTNPTPYSTESRPSYPQATSHAHNVIRYLYPLPFPHPHPTPKHTHLHPTAPTIPFYGSIFCVLLWYYTICFMFHLT